MSRHVDGPRYSSPPWDLFAYIVPANLLQVNRQINREATRELYRRVSLATIFVKQIHNPFVDHWLKKHPLRLTQSLIIQNGFSPYCYPRQCIETASRAEMRDFITLLNSFPNLVELAMVFTDWAHERFSFIPESPSLQPKSLFLRHLESLRKNIRRSVKLVLHFDYGHSWAANSPWIRTPLIPPASELVATLEKRHFVLCGSDTDALDIDRGFQMTRRASAASD